MNPTEIERIRAQITKFDELKFFSLHRSEKHLGDTEESLGVAGFIGGLKFTDHVAQLIEQDDRLASRRNLTSIIAFDIATFTPGRTLGPGPKDLHFRTHVKGSVSLDDGSLQEFKIDPAGQRPSRKVNGISPGIGQNKILLVLVSRIRTALSLRDGNRWRGRLRAGQESRGSLGHRV